MYFQLATREQEISNTHVALGRYSATELSLGLCDTFHRNLEQILFLIFIPYLNNYEASGEYAPTPVLQTNNRSRSKEPYSSWYWKALPHPLQSVGHRHQNYYPGAKWIII